MNADATDAVLALSSRDVISCQTATIAAGQHADILGG